LVQEAIFSEEYYKPMHFLFFDFLCRADNDDVKLDNRELSEYRWFGNNEIHKVDAESYTKNLLQAYKEHSSGDSSLSYIPSRSHKI